jgi:hypothetical protein
VKEAAPYVPASVGDATRRVCLAAVLPEYCQPLEVSGARP